MRINNQFSDIKNKASQWFSSLSQREKGLTVVAGLIAAMFLFSSLYTPIAEAFSNQEVQFETSKSSLRDTPRLLRDYLRLTRKRDAIEKRYKEVSFPEGALAHLEKLLLNKAKIPQGQFNIGEKTQPFGPEYEQEVYTIKFRTTSLSNLADLLKEITKGDKPLLLSRLDLTKSYSGDRVDVDMDVSSLIKKGLRDIEEG